MDACSDRWRLFFRVALSTGLRRGEMIGLRWGDVSLSERVIDVRRSICPYDDIEDDDSLTTKTEAGERVVPLFPDALEALEELYRFAGRTGDDDPVFGTVEPKPAINGRRASIPGRCSQPADGDEGVPPLRRPSGSGRDHASRSAAHDDHATDRRRAPRST